MGEKYLIAILANGDHVMYQEMGSQWGFPTIVSVKVDAEKKEPFIWFDPLFVFAKSEKIPELDAEHIMTTYKPNENIIKAREEFEERYYQVLENQQKSKLIVHMNKGKTIH